MRTTAIRISSGGQIELIVHFPQECHLLLSKIPFGTPTRAAAMHGLSLLMTLQSLDMSQRWKGISSSAFAPSLKMRFVAETRAIGRQSHSISILKLRNRSIWRQSGLCSTNTAIG